MLLPIVVAIFLGTWGLPPSLLPQPAQGVENQPQPTHHNAAAEPSIEKQKGEPDQGAGKKEHEQSYVERMLKLVREYNAEVVAISTAIMALFTTALFAATFLLWYGGEKHSERELRAYIFPVRTEVKRFEKDQPVEVVLHAKNSGHTPAFEVQTTFSLFHAPFPANKFPALVWEPTKASIGPGTTFNIGPLKIYISDGDRSKIISGERALYFSGEIRYRDAFKKKRYTESRAFYVGEGNLPNRPFPMSQTDEGNHAT
ncbi:MAG: hypothetical protein QOF93_513 [Verrucomicrobiota bacterium]